MAARWTLMPGDCRESLEILARKGVQVDSVATDPPYHLHSVVKRFGKEGAAPAREGTDGAFRRASRGFMSKTWDGGDIAHDPDFWRLVLAVMKPGAYLAAFSSARTGHRQASALEDAGFVIHPMLGWLFSSGMPKDHDAAKALDKQLGARGETEPLGNPIRRMIPGADQNRTGSWVKDNGRSYQPGAYIPATPEAARWDGWAYGAQALKPAFEPVYIGQKPFSEKNGALNLLKHGVGAINIDGCRVEPTGEKTGWGGGSHLFEGGLSRESGAARLEDKGRHPANLVHDGSPEVVAMFPESKGQLAAVGPEHGSRKTVSCYGDYGPRPFTPPRGDSGSAARFFNCFPPDGDPVFYAPKASKADRAGSGHPTVKPQSLMRWLCRLITPPGGLVLDPFAGSGSTGRAAVDEGFRCLMMEAEEEYCADIRRRMYTTHTES